MTDKLPPGFQSHPMRCLVDIVHRVAGNDVPVFITGETGCGKEILCDMLHAASGRAGECVKINCAALPADLVEAELFGSMRGSYTGSNGDKVGLFRQAENGTLFLDEISEMPIAAQGKLLRVLQDKRVRPVGGVHKETYQATCRIVASSNMEHEKAIRLGKFREDLFYRISAVTLHVPALKDRRDDIIPLANVFLRKYRISESKGLELSPEAELFLKARAWPGNVRQLENAVRRAILFCDGPAVSVPDFGLGDDHSYSVQDMTPIQVAEMNEIAHALFCSGGNKLKAAKKLGIGRQTLYNKIALYGLKPKEQHACLAS